MLHPTQSAKEYAKAAVIIVLLLVCVLPILYFGVYRVVDYTVCRSAASLRLGMGFAPFSIEDYIRRQIPPGISHADALFRLQAIGSVEIVHLGSSGNDVSTDQVNLRLCSHPLNRIILFINYARSGDVISIKFAGD